MGPGRSVRGLAAKYRKTSQNLAPTQSYPTLRDWSEKFEWFVRAAEFDADGDEEKSALRAQALCDGLAQDFERVESLKKVAKLVEDQIFETGIPRKKRVKVVCPECLSTVEVTTGDLVQPYHNLWVPDVKSVGAGESAERVDVEKFNSAILSEYRNLLDDIAKETAGRQKSTQIEHLIKSIYSKLDLNKLSKEQFDAISNGQHWLTVCMQPYLRDD